MTEMITAIGALLTGIGGLSAWRIQKRTHSIVRGNGRGSIDKMQERALDELASIRELLVDHITDRTKHSQN